MFEVSTQMCRTAFTVQIHGDFHRFNWQSVFQVMLSILVIGSLVPNDDRNSSLQV